MPDDVGKERGGTERRRSTIDVGWRAIDRIARKKSPSESSPTNIVADRRARRGTRSRRGGTRRTAGRVEDHLEHGPGPERRADDVRDSL
eukprot:25575-Pelagococcus_subviridis.AAC.4